mmetsp:Transcript_2857/g.7272  ORF Transcript_2857/g.7272 Transcript_2857/m.7272 type:complete len:204 (-) Transcript_2857:831-1442(-)
MKGVSSMSRVRESISVTAPCHAAVAASSTGACQLAIWRVTYSMSACTCAVVSAPCAAWLSSQPASNRSSSSSRAAAARGDARSARIDCCSSPSTPKRAPCEPAATCAPRASQKARVAVARTRSSSSSRATASHGCAYCVRAAASASAPPSRRICISRSSGGSPTSPPSRARCSRSPMSAACSRPRTASTCCACLGTSCADQAA